MLLPPSSKNVSEGLIVFAIVPGISFAHTCATLSSVSVNCANIEDLRRLVADSIVISGNGNFGLSTLPLGFSGIVRMGTIIDGTA